MGKIPFVQGKIRMIRRRQAGVIEQMLRKAGLKAEEAKRIAVACARPQELARLEATSADSPAG